MARRGATETANDDRTAVFVSYSRRDTAFVEAMKPRLEALDLEVWLDLEDIPPSADWRDEIQDGIERCEALIVVVSPESAGSTEVGKEISRADELGKRIVPVLHREVDPGRTQPAVARRNWVRWPADDHAESALALIDQALTADPAWAKEHRDSMASPWSGIGGVATAVCW